MCVGGGGGVTDPMLCLAFCVWPSVSLASWSGPACMAQVSITSQASSSFFFTSGKAVLQP